MPSNNWRRIVAPTALMCCFASLSSAQLPYYNTLQSGSPQVSQPERPSLGARVTGWFSRKPSTRVSAPPPAAVDSSLDPSAANGNLPSKNAQIKREEYIDPNERPGPYAAVPVPVGGGSSLFGFNRSERRINFPRDRADDLDVLKLQVFLDYHGYSVGEIEGQWDYNTERALYVYQRNNGMQPTGQLDDRILARINAFSEGYLVDYTITSSDLAGPFHAIPREYYAQAKMSYLPYESAIEALGEKFHCSQVMLRKLNPGVDFERLQPGQKIYAPNVVGGIDDSRTGVAVIRVSKANKWIETFDGSGRFVFYYPSTLGSQYDPLPLGNYSVTGVIEKPPFKYQPKLFWDANPNDPEAMIPPGPNSPVGPIWIATSASQGHLGIHGTPNPENISKNTSHGCIRLTNWDAKQLAARVHEGTKIEFVP